MSSPPLRRSSTPGVSILSLAGWHQLGTSAHSIFLSSGPKQAGDRASADEKSLIDLRARAGAYHEFLTTTWSDYEAVINPARDSADPSAPIIPRRPRQLSPRSQRLAQGSANGGARNPSQISEEKGAVPSSGRLGSVDLSLIPLLEACSPGFAPTEYNVLIAPPDRAEKTAGNIFLSDETKDADFMAAQLGRIIAKSPIAFNYDDAWARTTALQPKIGDIVWFARYAGTTLEGLDGRTYRIVKDRDIGGIITP